MIAQLQRQINKLAARVERVTAQAGYPFPLSNFNATAAPTATDDASKGYGRGSHWIYNGVVSTCSDSTTGAAVWGGVASLTVETITAATTLDSSHSIVLCDTSAGSYAVTLPDAGGIAGYVYRIKNLGTNTLTIDTTGADTIDGMASLSIITQYESHTVVSDGSTWSEI